MTAPVNLSFELEGTHAGVPLGWTWGLPLQFASASYATVTGVSRFEIFSIGWGADVFVGSLTPSNTVPTMFGSLGLKAENFERQWRLPATPPPDGSHPGNETSLFAWAGGLAGPYDNFESSWLNVPYFTAWSGILFVSFTDNFESWVSSYVTALTTGNTTPAVFAPGGGNENFETVRASLPFVGTVPSTLQFGIVPPYAVNDLVTLSNAGDGALPTGVNPSLNYYVVLVAGTTIQVSTTVGGTAITFSDPGSGTNSSNADPSHWWTETDVGL